MSAPITLSYSDIVTGASEIIRQVTRSDAVHRAYPQNQFTVTTSTSYVTVLDEVPQGMRRIVNMVSMYSADSGSNSGRVRVVTAPSTYHYFNAITVASETTVPVYVTMSSTVRIEPFALTPGQSVEFAWNSTPSSEGNVMVFYDEFV